jgi:type I restriction-modification system DNA methylase subunit
VDLRRKLIEENRLDGVVSMPSGVFKPYAGVSTAVLFFTRGAQTKDIWFYEIWRTMGFRWMISAWQLMRMIFPM